MTSPGSPAGVPGRMAPARGSDMELESVARFAAKVEIDCTDSSGF